MEAEVISELVVEWPVKTLTEISRRIVSGGTPSRKVPAYYQDGVWPWVKTQELEDRWIEDTEEHITEKAVARSSAKILEPNTILVAMYGATVGQLGLLARQMACNQACCAIEVEPSKADFRYVYYQLLYHRKQLKSSATGAAQQNLNVGLFRSFAIPIPPLFEQQAIADVLGALDDKIELNRKMNETLDELARTIFRSWFVDFDPVRAKMEGREPFGMDAETAALFPDRLVDSPKGLIPEGWDVSTIGKEVRVLGGSTPSTKNPHFWEGGTHLWATPKDLSGLASPMLIETSRQITDAGVQQISSRQLPIGTVLLSSRAPVGYLALTTEPTSINQGFIAMVCDSVLPNYYVLNWARESMEIIKSNAGGTTFAEISKTNFRPIQILVPNVTVLQAFEETVSSMYEMIEHNLREARTLAELRDTLLPELISGRIRVPEAARVVGEAV